jgi:hypothetical protein
MSAPLPVPRRTVPCPIVLRLAREEAVFGGRLRDDPHRVRVRPGVYADAAEWAPFPPRQRYLARVHAYALRHPDAVFCLESAAALLGLPLFGEPRDIHVFDVTATVGRRSGDVVIHTSATARGLLVGELITTSVLDTTVDLIRVLPPAFGLAVADAAARLATAGVSEATILDVLADQASSRGRARAQWVAGRVDAAAESVGESVSRAVIEWCGFPAPVLQQWFESEGHHDRTDFFFPSVRAIGEADGYGKYLTGGGRVDPETLFAEKPASSSRPACRWSGPRPQRGSRRCVSIPGRRETLLLAGGVAHRDARTAKPRVSRAGAAATSGGRRCRSAGCRSGPAGC